MPLPQLLYAQVVKSYRRRRLVAVNHRVMFGTTARVKQVGSSSVLVNQGWSAPLGVDQRGQGGDWAVSPYPQPWEARATRQQTL
jgi:hypothetical protein